MYVIKRDDKREKKEKKPKKRAENELQRVKIFIMGNVFQPSFIQYV